VSDIDVAGIQLSLTGPEQLRAAAVRLDSPTYDMNQTFFRLIMRNAGGHPITMPLAEIRRNVMRVYTNLETGRSEMLDEPLPPIPQGLVETIAPGESREITVQFIYPEALVERPRKVLDIRFCVRWRPEWLRSQYYEPGSYQWNEPFDVCTDVTIVDA
jgi:hypothetical protein